MPVFEFTCRSCEHHFEELVFEGDRVQCPECQSAKVEKQLSAPAYAKTGGGALPTSSSCGDPSLPPCGAPWCQRKTN
jgi:putative FmdB family regulatory protein